MSFGKLLSLFPDRDLAKVAGVDADGNVGLSAYFGGMVSHRLAIPTAVMSADYIQVGGFYAFGDAGAGAVYTSIGATTDGPMPIRDLYNKLFAALSMFQQSDRTQANFGRTTYAYAAPSGFSNWS